MEIFKDNHTISRSIIVEILNGALTLNSYDSGDGFGEERIITVNDLITIKKVMDADTDEDLLNQMRARYSIGEAIDFFVEFLEKNKIEYQYHRFTD